MISLAAWLVTIGTVAALLAVAVLVVRAGWRAMHGTVPYERPRRRVNPLRRRGE